MADAAVSMRMEPLISTIDQWIKEEISLIKNVKDKLKQVSSKLRKVQNVLDDAEKQSVTKKYVKDWLDDLKYISYDMDDVLDEWNTSVSKRKLEEEEEEVENPSDVPTEKISCSSFFTSCISPVKHVGMRRDLALKIKDIDSRLDSVVKQMDQFKFDINQKSKSSVDDSLKDKRQTNPLIEKSKIHGRDDDEKIILSKLLSEGSREQTQNIPIISIVGLGGLGKTTLAKLVYNNDNVAKSFSKRIWVCVSDPFNISQVVRDIIVSIDGTAPNVSSLDLLLTHLKQSISSVKFLLVLDDVWDKEGKNWEDIRNCLKSGAIGSRVLVTTRKEEVARVMGTSTTNLHHLGRLSEIACRSLFSQIAFADKDEVGCDKLREIGEKIVVKCKGLPLAVMTLGSLLRFKDNIEDWEHVLNSRIWELEQAEVDLFPHLYLSYNELSLPVQRCFSYCSIFPKDTKIDVDELIRIWIAQGYVRFEIDAERDISLKGQDYFDKLTMCCFFQDFEFDNRGKIVRCKMHDIVHDFAQYLSRNECTTIANGTIPYNTKFEKIRHLNSEIESVPRTICDVGKLRSFFSCSNKLLGQEAVVLFNHLKCVRVLVLVNIGLKKLPNEVGNLVHLRYLDLSMNTELDTLPESVCELYNLQTLNIGSCSALRKLPQSIGKLTNLRHLLNYSVDLEEYPKSFERLAHLETLSTFVVGKKHGKLEHLQQLLQHLRGTLTIEFRDTVDCEVSKLVVDAKKIQLKNNKYLRDLSLFIQNEEVGREEMWEALQPPPNTYTLNIYGICGKQYPSWLTNSLLLSNLRELHIYGTTPNCGNLPSLGKLSHLERLSIVWINNVKRIGREFLGIEEEDANEGDSSNIVRRATTPSSSSSSVVCAFPKLVRLDFFGLYEWEEWEDINHNNNSSSSSSSIQIMPQLRELKISVCQKLQQLPNWLLSKPVFPILEIFKCDILEANEVINARQRQFEQQFGDTDS